MTRKSYPKYKDSGIEWLGKVPEHWEQDRIKYSTYVKGRIGWKGLRADEFVEEGPYLVTGTDFQNGKVNWDTCYHITNERYLEDPYIQLKENDLLITKDGSIGKIAIVKNLPDRASLNSGIFVTRPIKSNYYTNFMYWILNSQTFNFFIDYMSRGSTINHLYQNVFEIFSFSLPSRQEQKAIADFLDKETSQIDFLIQKKEQQIELLKEKRSALITQAVTKGLNPNIKMKDSGIEWLGKIPKHWEVKKLKFISQIITGKTPPKNDTDNYSFDGIMWIKPDNLNEFMPISETKEYLSNKGVLTAKLVPEHSPLICCIGNIGKFGFSNHISTTNQQINAIIFNNQIINKKFGLYLCFSIKQEFQRYSNLNVVWILTSDKQKQIFCPKLEMKEQESITDFLDKETSRIDSLTEKIKKSIKLLKEYRSALITSAVTGQIDVRESQSEIANIVSLQKSKEESLGPSETVKPALIVRATSTKGDSKFIRKKKPVFVAKKNSKKSAALIFKKTALGAEIVAQLKDDPHFGRTKFMKTLYLCEAHLQIPLKGEYKRSAAGPLDSSIYKMEGIMKRNQWFEVIKTGSMFKYKSLKNPNGHKPYFDKYWKGYTGKLNNLLSLVKKFTTEQSEIVDTIYAVWNDFLLEGKNPLDSEIIHEVKNNWHESKKRFSDNQLQKAVYWMKGENLVPKGYGPKTKTSKEVK